MSFTITHAHRNKYKKAVLSQGKRAMNHGFFLRPVTLWLLFASVYERSRPL